MLHADAEGVITYLNTEAEYLFGFAADDLRGTTLQLLVSAAVDGAALTAGEGRLRFRRRSGDTFIAETTRIALAGADGHSVGTLMLVRDVTGQLPLEHELADTYRNIRILTDSLPCAIAELDLHGRCVFINELGATWYGTTPERLRGIRIREMLDRETRSMIRPLAEAAIAGRPQHYERQITYPDGVRRDVSVDYVPKHNDKGEIAGMVVFSFDVSARKNVERTLDRLYTITSSRQIDSTQKIKLILELGCSHFKLPHGVVARITGETCELRYVQSRDEALAAGTVMPIAESYCAHMDGSDEPMAIDHVSRSGLNGAACHLKFGFEVYIGAPILVDGEHFGTINFAGPEPRETPFDRSDREIIRQFADWIGNEIARERDLQELRTAKAELERLASVDALTGISNRRAFFEQANVAFYRAQTERRPLSLLMLDLDRFKSINDTYGHSIGDAVLRQVAASASQALGRTGVFGRLGGEEFAIVLADTDKEHAFEIAERIRCRIHAECGIEGGPEEVTICIGLATALGSDISIDAVLQRADRALYTAKKLGRNRTCVSTDVGLEEDALLPRRETGTG